MERTLSSELFSESNTVNSQASMPLRGIKKRQIDYFLSS